MAASRSNTGTRKAKPSRSRAAKTAKSTTKSSKPKASPRASRKQSTPTRRKTRSQPRPRVSTAVGRLAKKAGEVAIEQIVPGDAMDLLEQDHREAEAFFEQFERLESNGEKAKLAARICLALTVHTQIEEEFVYPMARKLLEQAELVDEAEVEHAAAKQLIAEIESMSPRDKLFDAKVKVLGEYVKHHVREEENELFPKMRERDLAFYKLGQRLAARKTALLIERRS